MTALVLVPLVIWGVLQLTLPLFAAGVGLFILLGAWEWGRLAGLTGIFPRAFFVAACALLLGWFWFIGNSPHMVDIFLYAALVWWLLGLVMVCQYNRRGSGFQLALRNKLVIGLLILLPTWVALVSLQAAPEFGPEFVLFLLFLIWSADSGAYFAGRQFGKRKLAAQVSPGKTWEGVIGGLLGVALVSLIWSVWQGYSISYALLFLVICLAVGLSSVLGDLVESLFKRQAGIKDSGSIFPGHGGMLDRIDSLTAAAPLFLLGLKLIRHIS